MPESHKESDATDQLSAVQHRGSGVVKTKPAVNRQAALGSLLARMLLACCRLPGVLVPY